jgi:hypothetical protein
MQRRVFRMAALIQHGLICLLARMDRYQNLRHMMFTKVTAQAALTVMNLNCLHTHLLKLRAWNPAYSMGLAEEHGVLPHIDALFA